MVLLLWLNISKNIIISNFHLQDIYSKLFVYICYIAIVYFFVPDIVLLSQLINKEIKMKGYTMTQKTEMAKSECAKVYKENPNMDLDEQEELCYLIKEFIFNELPTVK